MSSSDLASPQKAVSDELNSAEENDSLDASLDAILSEAREGVAQPLSEGEAPPALESLAPPAAEVQMALSTAAADGIDDDMETPLPVIVDDVAGYRAFTEEVAPAGPEAVAATDLGAEAAATFESEPAVADALPADQEELEEAEEILEAESLVESETPAPVAADAEALVATQETSAYTAPAAATDDELLGKLVLPPGTTPSPLALSSAAGASSLLDGDEDRTVISPFIPEPAPSLPAPRTIWSQAAEAAAVPAAAPMMLSSQRYAEEGLGAKLRKVVGAKVQTSVGVLAFAIVGASALGGVVGKMASSSGPVAVTSSPAAKAEPVKDPLPAMPALPAAAAPAAAPTPAAPVVAEKPAEKPAAKPASKPPRVAVPSRPRAAAAPATKIALAAPTKPAAAPAAKPAAAPAPAAPATKPAAAPAKKAGQGGNWVDPFGQ
jgi:hypothetical protein